METQLTYVTPGRHGQPVRVARRVAGAVLLVGRGTGCQVHLPDPRVLLEHARITVSGDEATIASLSGELEVNGRVVDAQRIVPGDRIDIGPFRITVDPPPDAAALALRIEPSSRLAADAGREAQQVLLPPARSWRRTLSYLMFFGILVPFLLLPAAPDLFAPGGMAAAWVGTPSAADAQRLREGADRMQQSWDPGPLMNAHQAAAFECRACHELPFVQVRDRACLECHKGIRDHVPHPELTGPDGERFAATRCAECHRDHKGPQAQPFSQAFCADCHRDIRRTAGQAQSGKVVDFARDHPEFRLSLLDPGEPPQVRRVRLNDVPPPRERSNLKFNHEIHLDAKGIRGPQRREVLECASCHEPERDGRRFAPVTMERHCQSCHALTFEPGATRQVPHGRVEAMLPMLRDYYARQLYAGTLAEERATARARPGADSTPLERSASLGATDRRAELALRELFETRAVCSTCHEVLRARDPAGGPTRWDVAPVRVTQAWMPYSSFTHASHATAKCGDCHQVERSRSAADVAMPGVRECRECHVGARAEKGKVRSECALCHGFHGTRESAAAEVLAALRAKGVHR